MSVRRWRWWRDCRLIGLRHWTAYGDPRRPGGRDEDGYQFHCTECGYRWGRL